MFGKTYSCLNPTLIHRRLCPPAVSVHVTYTKIGRILGAFANWRKAYYSLRHVYLTDRLCVRMLTPRFQWTDFHEI